MRRLSKTKIELEKILKANVKQRKMARGAKTPAGVRENQLLPSNNWAIELDGDADSWVKSFGGLLKLREAANDPENLELFANLLDTEHAIDGIRKILVDNFFDGDIEEKLMRMWYPDGTVTSSEQWSTDLKYDWENADSVNHTVEVLAFAADGVTPSNGDAVGDIVIPPYVETNGVRYAVTAVGAYGDQGSPSGAAITSLKAPTTVTQIGYGAFYYCSSLTSVSLPATTNIGNSAFYSCSLLTSVSLPAVTDIGNSAFESCSLLTSVSLPAATDIGIGAFYGCAALASVDFGPDARQDAPELGEDAFPSLSGHTCRIIVPDGNYDAWIAEWSHLLNIGYEFTKYGGMYLKDSGGHYWEITVSTGGTITAVRATPQGSVN